MEILLFSVIVASLLILGVQLATQSKCPECRSKVSRRASICPSCQTAL